MISIAVGDTFSDFDSFKERIDSIAAETRAKFVIRDGKTVAQANKLLKMGSKKYEEKFKYARVRFECRHGSTYKSKSMGFRPHQKTLKLGCPVAIVASVDRTAEAIIIREVNLMHNHDLLADVSVLKTKSELSEETKGLISTSMEAEEIAQGEKLETTQNTETELIEEEITDTSFIGNATVSYVELLPTPEQPVEEIPAQVPTEERYMEKTFEGKLQFIISNLQEATRLDELTVKFMERELHVGMALSADRKLSIVHWEILMKMADFLQNGCKITVLHEDTNENDETSEKFSNLEEIITYNENVIRASLTLMSADPKKVDFVLASSFQYTQLFTKELNKLVSKVSITDAMADMSNGSNTLTDTFAKARLALSEERLGVDAWYGPAHMEKTFQLAETYLPSLKYAARSHLIGPPILQTPEEMEINFEANKEKVTEIFNNIADSDRTAFAMTFTQQLLYPHLIRNNARGFELRKLDEDSVYLFPAYEDLEAAVLNHMVAENELVSAVVEILSFIIEQVSEELTRPSDPSPVQPEEENEAMDTLDISYSVKMEDTSTFNQSQLSDLRVSQSQLTDLDSSMEPLVVTDEQLDFSIVKRETSDEEEEEEEEEEYELEEGEVPQKKQEKSEEIKEDSRDMYSCSICDEEYNSKILYMIHLNLKHPDMHPGLKDGDIPVVKEIKLPEHTEENEDDSKANKKPPTKQQSTPARKFECASCGESFLSQEEAREHVANHYQSDETVDCLQCGAKFLSMEGLAKHEVKEHQDRAAVCDICGKDFSSSEKLRDHYNVHTGEMPYSCKHCDKRFNKENLWKLHEARHFNTKPYWCDECGRGFASQQSLRLHGAQHTGIRPFQCVSCGKGFLLKSQLLKHEKKHEEEDPDEEIPKVKKPKTPSNRLPESQRLLLSKFKTHGCQYCPKKFASDPALRLHLKRNHDIILPSTSNRTPRSKELKCRHCGQAFDRRFHLVEHERSHTGFFPFICTFCKRGFHSKGAWERHERTHRGDKPFACGVCAKCFTDKRMVQVHMRSHTGERPYGCHYCPKRFTQKNALDEHERIHTGERPFKCQYCGKGFTHRSHVPLHERMHTGERPYVCRVCTASFNRKENCLKHIRKHPEYTEDLGPAHMFMGRENPKDIAYMCSVCRQTFSDKDECTQHVETCHDTPETGGTVVEAPAIPTVMLQSKGGDSYEYAMEVTQEEAHSLQSLMDEGSGVLTLVIPPEGGQAGDVEVSQTEEIVG